MQGMDLSANKIVERAKYSKETRSIPVPDDLLPDLNAHVEQCSGFLFTNTDGGDL
jgi:hypothetical protein